MQAINDAAATAAAEGDALELTLESRTPADEAGGREGSSKRGETADCRARRAGSQAADSCDGKAFVTSRARAALAGLTLLRLADGGFVIGCWGLSRRFETLAEVDGFIARAAP